MSGFPAEFLNFKFLEIVSQRVSDGDTDRCAPYPVRYLSLNLKWPHLVHLSACLRE